MTWTGQIVSREAFAFLNQSTNKAGTFPSPYLCETIYVKAGAAAAILLSQKKGPENSRSVGLNVVEPLNQWHRHSKVLIM